MSQVYAAKYVLPQMIERGSGYLLNTASAAGLAMEYHSALYTTTKHADIGLAEWLAVTYREAGIRVSVLCPGAVKIPMAVGIPALMEEAIELDVLVDKTILAIQEEQFMISTHENIWNLFQMKSQDYNKYIDLHVQRRAHKLGLESPK